MSRERTTSIRCAKDGCRESATYEYTSQREFAEIYQSQKRAPYLCSRHRRPDEVLRPDNQAVTGVLVASRVRNSRYERNLAEYRAALARQSMFAREPEQFIPGLYWLPEGADRGGSGLVSGPGFRAHADDFPEGTRLVVTVRVEVPAEVTP